MIRALAYSGAARWIPAFAGMTGEGCVGMTEGRTATMEGGTLARSTSAVLYPRVKRLQDSRFRFCHPREGGDPAPRGATAAPEDRAP